MIKMFKKLRIKENFFNTIGVIHTNTIYFIFNDERLDSSEDQNKIEIYVLLICINYYTGHVS